MPEDLAPFRAACKPWKRHTDACGSTPMCDDIDGVPDAASAPSAPSRACMPYWVPVAVWSLQKAFDDVWLNVMAEVQLGSPLELRTDGKIDVMAHLQRPAMPSTCPAHTAALDGRAGYSLRFQSFQLLLHSAQQGSDTEALQVFACGTDYKNWVTRVPEDADVLWGPNSALWTAAGSCCVDVFTQCVTPAEELASSSVLRAVGPAVYRRFFHVTFVARSRPGCQVWTFLPPDEHGGVPRLDKLMGPWTPFVVAPDDLRVCEVCDEASPGCQPEDLQEDTLSLFRSTIEEIIAALLVLPGYSQSVERRTPALRKNTIAHVPANTRWWREMFEGAARALAARERRHQGGAFTTGGIRAAVRAVQNSSAFKSLRKEADASTVAPHVAPAPACGTADARACGPALFRIPEWAVRGRVYCSMASVHAPASCDRLPTPTGAPSALRAGARRRRKAASCSLRYAGLAAATGVLLLAVALWASATLVRRAGAGRTVDHASGRQSVPLRLLHQDAGWS